MKPPETATKVCEPFGLALYEVVIPWALVMDADWPASRVDEDPRLNVPVNVEFPVTTGTRLPVAAEVVGVVPEPVVPEPVLPGSASGVATAALTTDGMVPVVTSCNTVPVVLPVPTPVVGLAATTSPNSELFPPAVFPASAGKIRYEGAGGSVRRWT